MRKQTMTSHSDNTDALDLESLRAEITEIRKSINEIKELMISKTNDARIYNRSQFCNALGIGWRRLVSVYQKYNLNIPCPMRSKGNNPEFSQQDYLYMKDFLNNLKNN